MFKAFRTSVAIIVVCFLAPMVAEGQTLADRDVKKVTEYLLTDAVLAKYAQAVRKLHRSFFSVRHNWGQDRQLRGPPNRAPDHDTHH